MSDTENTTPDPALSPEEEERISQTPEPVTDGELPETDTTLTPGDNVEANEDSAVAEEEKFVEGDVQKPVGTKEDPKTSADLVRDEAPEETNN